MQKSCKVYHFILTTKNKKEIKWLYYIVEVYIKIVLKYSAIILLNFDTFQIMWGNIKRKIKLKGKTNWFEVANKR